MDKNKFSWSWTLERDLMTSEEQGAWVDEQIFLSKSASLEDRGVSIMMDMRIGGEGHSGDCARAKVKALLEMFRRNSGSQKT
jgi:hypothetical protein